MNSILQAWNASDTDSAINTLLSCCAAYRWAEGITAQRPYTDERALFITADRIWATMQESDWIQAFRAHPRIGEREPVHASAQSATWSQQEQSSTNSTQSLTLAELANGNVQYEALFGFTYIVCATGKSAEEMLEILRRRMASNRQSELREAAEQQRQITQIRLRKWLQA
jgi:2-oxo-4-hydroxy-4-carboxy-5-ureidoimidazoline decarboxylase